MTGATSLAYPNSRVLAGWWRQLAPVSPRRLWVGHYLFHRLEALVQVHQVVPLDSFTLVLLKALTLGPTATLPELDERLQLGRQVLFQVLRRLEAAELALQTAPATWTLTPLGQQALAQGRSTREGRERRLFHFVEPLDSD